MCSTPAPKECSRGAGNEATTARSIDSLVYWQARHKRRQCGQTFHKGRLGITCHLASLHTSSCLGQQHGSPRLEAAVWEGTAARMLHVCPYCLWQIVSIVGCKAHAGMPCQQVLRLRTGSAPGPGMAAAVCKCCVRQRPACDRTTACCRFFFTCCVLD